MRQRNLFPYGGLILCTLIVLPVSAQRGFESSSNAVRRSSDWDPNRRDGQCTIRVRVDGEADVALRGDRLMIKTVSGSPSQIVGSECNAPLPMGGIRDFQLQGMEGRGEVNLTQEPKQENRWAAMVTIRDQSGGAEEYTYRLSWTRDGTMSMGSGGFWEDRTGSSSGREGGFWGNNQQAVPRCQRAVRDKLIPQYGGNIRYSGTPETWDAGNGEIGIKGRARYTDRTGIAGDIDYECRYQQTNGQIKVATYRVANSPWGQ